MEALNDNCAGILEQSMGARNRVGIGLLYRPARLHRLAELISLNRYIGWRAGTTTAYSIPVAPIAELKFRTLRVRRCF